MHYLICLVQLKSSHETAINQVLEFHDPSALDGSTPFGSQGTAVTQIEQSQKITLGSIDPQGLAQHPGLNIVSDQRALSHSMDAGLGSVWVVQ